MKNLDVKKPPLLAKGSFGEPTLNIIKFMKWPASSAADIHWNGLRKPTEQVSNKQRVLVARLRLYGFAQSVDAH